MRKSHTDENAYYSPLYSPKCSSFKHRFAQSQELNSAYHPNFKKLSSRKKQYHSLTHFSIKQLFSAKSIQKIITQQCQYKNYCCNLCECNYKQQEMFSLCKYGHIFCQNCLIQYVSYKISAMEQLRCPQQLCNEKASLQCEIFQKLPDQLKKRYYRAQIWRQTMSNPDLKLCPIQYCQGQVDMKLTPHACNVCKKQFCPQCMMQKHIGNCDTIYQATHKQWRRCPSCRMFIAKTQGCNHIRCRCNCEFCFVCLQKWDSSHYNCMEKAQMIYFNADDVKMPLLLAVIMVLLLPILILLAAVAIIGCFFIMIPVGFVMGLGLTIMKFIHLFCLVIIILPIGGVVGALAFPFYFTFGHVFPYFVHHFRRYKITIQQLFISTSQTSR